MNKNKKKKKHVTATRNPDAPMINIGATEESVASARGVIMDILNCEKSGDEAKVAAFDTLKSLCQVSNVTIRECNFTTK